MTKLIWKASDGLLFSCHGDGYCYGWNTKTNEMEQKLMGHTKRILGMCFSPFDENELCTLGADEKLVFWDTKMCQKKKPEF